MKTVTSKDGTKIAYEKIGNGPSVILVEGATSTSAYSTKLANLLTPHFTVYYYDRRGRGESTDTKPYSIEKEIEDIEALVDLAGGSAYLYGISSGGCLALEAASKLGNKITKLAIYEAPYDESEKAKEQWHEYTTDLKKAVDSDNRAEAIALFMRLVGVPEDMITGMKQSPMWPGLLAVAPTLLYDAACMGDDRSLPVHRFKQITAQTLIMDGGGNLAMMPFMHTSAEKLAQVIPHCQRQTLDGQTHDVDMAILAPVLEMFFKG